MPGTNLLASSAPLSLDERCRFYHVQKAMLHTASYRDQILHLGEKIAVGFSSWDGYPKWEWKSGGIYILIEGVLYEPDDKKFQKQLCSIATDPGLSAEARKAAFADLVSSADGEFLVIFHDTVRGQLLVANDSLGRLPLFYAQSGRFLIISREPKFIYPFLPSITLDRQGMTGLMLFGFAFGQRTLVEGISQAEPGTIIEFNTDNNKFSVTVHPGYTTDGHSWAGRKEVVSTMQRLFSQSVAGRARAFQDRPVVVSLSGGLDSRAVLGQLAAYRSGIRAVTISGTPDGAREIELARKIAASYGIEIDLIDGEDKTRGTIDLQSVAMTDGRDAHHIQAQLHSFLEKALQKYGANAIYFTGTYGGELTRYLHPTANISSVDGLVNYLLKSRDEYKYSTENTLRIMGMARQELFDSLRRYLDGLPEESTYGKYLRFRHDYDRQYTGNGDDRNRFYLWATTPFASLPFVRYAVSLNENRKNIRLVRDFLYAIDPKLCDVPYFNFNVSLKHGYQLYPLSVVERLARFAVLKSSLQQLNRWGNFLRRHETEQLGQLRAILLELLEQEPQAATYLNVKGVIEVLHEEHDAQGLSRLRILLLYMGWVRSFLKKIDESCATDGVPESVITGTTGEPVV